MPVSLISDRCLQIRRFGFINCYLVRETDGLTLIDTAVGAARIIMEAARHLRQPLRRIVLTHAHADHVGSVDMVKKLAPDVHLFIGARDAQLLAEASRGVARRNMKLLPGEAPIPVKGSFKKVKTTPDTLLNENDAVGSLRVLATPGHTPGHISFLDERDGAFYAGDALCTFQETRLPFDPPSYFPLIKGGTWHDSTALRSIERLVDSGIKRVLAGHGPARESSRASLEQAIVHARRKVRA